MKAVLLAQRSSRDPIKAYEFEGSVYDLFSDIKMLRDKYELKNFAVLDEETWKYYCVKIIREGSVQMIYNIIWPRENYELLVLTEYIIRSYMFEAQFYGNIDLLNVHRQLLEKIRKTLIQDEDKFARFCTLTKICIRYIDKFLRIGYTVEEDLQWYYVLVDDIPRSKLERMDTLKEFAEYLVLTFAEKQDKIGKIKFETTRGFC